MFNKSEEEATIEEVADDDGEIEEKILQEKEADSKNH